MTQEEKQLLLKDLCARLPYGVKLGFENSNLILVPKEFNIYTMQLSTNQIYPESDSMVIGHVYDVWNYRPYLRPISSMTENEIEEHEKTFDLEYSVNGTPYDWLNAHYIDYRGLIGKGLALEAPEGMY
jgi:hypothetical protein